MRTLIFLALLGFFAHKAYLKYNAVTVETSEDGMLLMEKGRNKMELERLGEVKVDLRVFGLADGNTATRGKIGPFVFISHMVFATPLAENEAVFAKYLCERTSVDQAALIQLITDDEKLDAKIENLRKIEGRRCARVEGISYEIARFFVDGEDITETMQFSSTPNSDPWKIIKVTGIDAIDC